VPGFKHQWKASQTNAMNLTSSHKTQKQKKTKRKATNNQTKMTNKENKMQPPQNHDSCLHYYQQQIC
jgi:hypothetical protein